MINLSNSYHKHIGSRDLATQQTIRTLWGVTWANRGQSLVPFGNASLMVLSSNQGQVRNKERIELTCVLPRLDVKTKSIVYDDIKRSHDLGLTPAIGAHGKQLDPRFPGDPTLSPQDKPDGVWLALALELEMRRYRVVTSTWSVDSIPQLPTFYAAYSELSEVELPVNSETRQKLARIMQRQVEYVDTLSDVEAAALIKASIAEFVIKPGKGINATDKFLLNIKYLDDLSNLSYAQIYEDHSHILGVSAFNPTYNLFQSKLKCNPTHTCATELGIRMKDFLAEFETCTSDDNGNYSALMDRFDSLKERVTRALRKEGIASLSDDELNEVILNPTKRITTSATNLVELLGTNAATRAFRNFFRELRPALEIGLTDAEIVKAMQYPNKPVYCRNVSQFQILHRDPLEDPADTFSFTSDLLERKHVSMDLWPGDNWAPTSKENHAVHATS